MTERDRSEEIEETRIESSGDDGIQGYCISKIEFHNLDLTMNQNQESTRRMDEDKPHEIDLFLLAPENRFHFVLFLETRFVLAP